MCECGVGSVFVMGYDVCVSVGGVGSVFVMECVAVVCRCLRRMVCWRHGNSLRVISQS